MPSISSCASDTNPIRYNNSIQMQKSEHKLDFFFFHFFFFQLSRKNCFDFGFVCNVSTLDLFFKFGFLESQFCCKHCAFVFNIFSIVAENDYSFFIQTHIYGWKIKSVCTFCLAWKVMMQIHLAKNPRSSAMTIGCKTFHAVSNSNKIIFTNPTILAYND